MVSVSTHQPDLRPRVSCGRLLNEKVGMVDLVARSHIKKICRRYSMYVYSVCIYIYIYYSVYSICISRIGWDVPLILTAPS